MKEPDHDGLTLTFSLSEGKLVFEALAELPFKHVYELIGKINSQVNARAAQSPGESTIPIHALALHEVDLILKALGEKPFNVVHGLVDNVNDQICAQVGASPSPSDLTANARA